MYTVASERLKKQDLILLQVKCQGANQDQFIDFIKNIKGEHFDIIDAWDLKELQSAVEGFQTRQKIGEESKSQVTQSQFMTMSQSNGGMTFSKSMLDKYYRQDIQCKQAQSNIFSNYFKENPKDMIDMSIVEYKVVDEGTFSPNYVKFKIELPQFGWSVWRRYNDFVWLHEILSTQFPDSLLPPVPKKTFSRLRFRKFSPDFLSKRQRMFELYLATIINTPLLRSSDYLLSFLSESDDVKFEGQIRASTILKKPQSYQDYTTLDGQLILEINPLLGNYYSHMTNYLENTNDVYKKTTDSAHALYESLQEAQSKFDELKVNLKSLRQLTDNFNQNNIIGNLGILSYTYDILDEYLIQWEKNMQNMVDMYQSNFYEFFRFQREMQDVTLDQIKLRNKWEQIYFKSQADLDQKKEKYFHSEPKEKWELGGQFDEKEIVNDKKLAFEHMFYTKQQEVYKNRDFFAFLNKYLIENFTQYFDIKGVIYTTRFLNSIKKKQQEFEEFHKELEDIAIRLDDIISMRNGFKPQILKEEQVSSYLNTLSITQIFNAK